jgi:primosomal replication protein N
LSGRLLAEPELRITPAGTPVLRLVVECGDAAEKLALAVLMAGEQGRAVSAGLRRGAAVEVSGRLRPAATGGVTRAGVEVVADRIEGRA